MDKPELEYLPCPTVNCGGQWLPSIKVKQLRESHEIFYCPSGHSQHFVQKTEKEKRIEELEKQIERLTKDRDWYRQRWHSLQEEEKKIRLSQYALKGVITKLKKAS